ncbi:hypothetical protein A3C96_02700 [Candidatus Uhrbacteria bacterium RIFCSPHIGHO2_02_FULL_60_10]|uniref:Transcriptional repressor n=1 Tax=Candidatus Uhrbacteria bacterium RIFCSPHIGHO2_02_FULL_60_10 TaxID=1802392 RepID=A0A1F7U6R0_9BACT|nr:MAG: hypothetical protein A3C96_02700 [Candidatus Uhrbacteria bacterium RIFCSPHIGHO2_02_FULL_60_10]
MTPQPDRRNDRLRARGLRQTKDRHELLNLFAQKRAWTVAELHRRLADANLSTVYRNIQKMTAVGLIRPIGQTGAEARFELSDRPHHAHLNCDRCAATACIPCPIDNLTADHTLEMRGRCEECKDK